MNIFVISGAAIITLLGLVHALYTLRSRPDTGPMTPTDPQVQEAMAVPGGLGLAPGLSMPLWKAWVGFNLSHSVGVVVVGLYIGLPALFDMSSAVGDPLWVVPALGLPVLYLAISRAYWFRDPTAGISVASLLIAVGVVGELVR